MLTDETKANLLERTARELGARDAAAPEVAILLRDRVDAEARVLTTEGDLAVTADSRPLAVHELVRVFLSERIHWIDPTRKDRLTMSGTNTTIESQVGSLDSAFKALEGAAEAERNAHTTAMAAFDEKFRAPDGEGSVATPQARAEYEKRVLDAGRAKRVEIAKAYEKQRADLEASLTMETERAMVLEDEVTAAAKGANLSRSEGLLARIAGRLDENEAREFVRTHSPGEIQQRYRATAANESQDRGFVRIVESMPLAFPGERQEFITAFMGEIRERRAARVPKSFQDIRANLDEKEKRHFGLLGFLRDDGRRLRGA